LNIFAVHENPWDAARALPDKLVVKMPIECNQMIAPWLFATRGKHIQRKDGNNYGTKGFANHPCSRWLYESDHNVKWLICHSLALCSEYNSRYLKTHACLKATFQALNHLGKEWNSSTDWRLHTPFPMAMPEKYRQEDRVKAYRNFVIHEKHYAEWNHSKKPEWWVK
jgi:hypothetical protein